MNVGVTATADGLERIQLLTLGKLLIEFSADEGEDWLLHGCCIGGDEQLATLARRVGYRLHGFPGRGLLDPGRSLILNDSMEDVPTTKTPELTRNRRIVAAADVLLAGPSGFTELRRSGTWATIRYAKEARVPLFIVYPDGTKNVEFAGTFAPGSTRNLPAHGARGVS